MPKNLVDDCDRDSIGSAEGCTLGELVTFDPGVEVGAMETEGVEAGLAVGDGDGLEFGVGVFIGLTGGLRRSNLIKALRGPEDFG